jgi:hypothetical protein
MTFKIFLLLVKLFAGPLDAWEASETYKAVCGPQPPAVGSFAYGVETDYERTGIVISALFWGDVDRKRHLPGEQCAVQWALNMFGQALAEDLYAAIQNLKWKVGEVWLYRRGLFFRLKRTNDMAPEVGSWYLGVYAFGLARRI